MFFYNIFYYIIILLHIYYYYYGINNNNNSIFYFLYYIIILYYTSDAVCCVVVFLIRERFSSFNMRRYNLLYILMAISTVLLMNEFMWWLEYVCCLFIYLLSTSIFNIIYLLYYIHISLLVPLSLLLCFGFFFLSKRERASFLQPRVCVCV